MKNSKIVVKKNTWMNGVNLEELVSLRNIRIIINKAI